MRIVVAMMLLLGGCRQILGIESASTPGAGDDAPIDGAIDAGPDTPPDALDPLCFGGDAFYVCLPQTPTKTLTLSGTLDTTTCVSPAPTN